VLLGQPASPEDRECGSLPSAGPCAYSPGAVIVA
jgi:hypothetical protein